ncbi:Putative ribonuclease H protein [Arachis hypogaea]|uniref:Ribonuclease H protein n=1 Tax=Arachis hypogaea TaxID=3818 RepID=A0A6B9VDB5_ARAHY|nr:Putative ribonuclease H protein [Arachis hypogaea]
MEEAKSDSVSRINKIGNVTITDADLWVVYNGLQLVIDLEIDRVKVESDSACVAQLLQNESNPFYGSSALIHAIKNLQSRMVNCVIHHVFREANFTADILAKHARNLPVGIHRFNDPSPFSCPFFKC